MKQIIFIAASLLLMTACVPQQTSAPQQAPAPQPKVQKKAAPYSDVPAAPKKEIELKEVEDENFSSDYMYPSTDKKKKSSEKTVSNTTADVPVAKSTATEMTKGECIGLIGQEKFNKYAQMYGGESAPLKKCKMLKTL